MEEEKLTMFCTTCNKKMTVLEGEVTCPVCGALLEAADPDDEDLLGVAEKDGNGILGLESSEKDEAESGGVSDLDFDD